MGFWNFLFGKPVKRNPGEEYFECERFFKPSGEQISLTARGVGMLTLNQEAFIVQLENNYSTIIAAVTPFVEDEFQNWKPDFKIGDFKHEFKPVYLEIPACDQKPVEWEIALETIHDRNHTIIITMIDYQPLHIHMDG